MIYSLNEGLFDKLKKKVSNNKEISEEEFGKIRKELKDIEPLVKQSHQSIKSKFNNNSFFNDICLTSETCDIYNKDGKKIENIAYSYTLSIESAYEYNNKETEEIFKKSKYSKSYKDYKDFMIHQYEYINSEIRKLCDKCKFTFKENNTNGIYDDYGIQTDKSELFPHISIQAWVNSRYLDVVQIEVVCNTLAVNKRIVVTESTVFENVRFI